VSNRTLSFDDDGPNQWNIKLSVHGDDRTSNFLERKIYVAVCQKAIQESRRPIGQWGCEDFEIPGNRKGGMGCRTLLEQ
jgi:hypothetical protein